MAYEKQNFTDGMTLHDYHLNNMEEQICTNEEQITSRLEVVDAMSSDCDMDTIFTSGEHCRLYRTNKNTLNTPYNKGITTLMRCDILSMTSSTTYGKQIAYVYGGRIFERKLNNGVISDWENFYNASEVKSLIQNAIDATWEASY